LKEHKQYVEVTVGRGVDAAKEMSNQAIDNVTTSVESMTTTAQSSIEEAKGQVATYKAKMQDQVDTYKTRVQEGVENVKGGVTNKVTTLSDESKAWATAFLNARVVQGKGALDTAQPYVIQAVGATQPYASRVVTAAEPYVKMAMPYVEEAKKMAESNQYVGPYVDPVLNTANTVIDTAKTYMGINKTANETTCAEAQAEQKVEATTAGN
jgi:hypothetical protein